MTSPAKQKKLDQLANDYAAARNAMKKYESAAERLRNELLPLMDAEGVNKVATALGSVRMVTVDVRKVDIDAAVKVLTAEQLEPVSKLVVALPKLDAAVLMGAIEAKQVDKFVKTEPRLELRVY